MRAPPARPPPRLTGVLLVLLLGWTAALSSCGLIGARDSSWDPFREPAANRIGIEVENATAREVTIHVVSSARRIELGTVPPRSTQRFQPTWTRREGLQIQLESPGERRVTLEGGTVAPGDRLELVARTPLAQSMLRR